MEQQTFFAAKGNRVLMGIVLVCAALALLAVAQNQWQSAQYQFSGPTTISVSGEGEVLAKPDIASFSFTVAAEAKDAAQAQEQSAKSINDITTYLQEQGIAEKDIKTQYYNLNPTYTYKERVCPVGSYCPPGDREIDGYEVSQSIVVKVRDLDTAGDLISGVGQRGATNLSGLQFTIDDETALQAEARAQAIADAKTKADALAADLGMRVVRVVGFSENGGYPVPYMAKAMDGLGGGMEDAAVAPELPTGENSITSTVTVSFELK